MPKVEVADNLKRPQSAYFLWLNANRSDIEKAAGSTLGPAVSKKAGEIWKGLPDAAKKPFEEQYKVAKEKYDAYLKSEEGAAAMSGLKEQRKEHKEANLKKDAKKAVKGIEKDEKLKKPTTAYWLWMNANRAEIEKAAGSKSAGAVGAKAGEMWKTVSAAIKKPFEEEAAKQKLAYDEYLKSEEGQAAMAQYKAAAKEAKESILGVARPSRKRKAEAEVEA
jgi:hypothetical protein